MTFLDSEVIRFVLAGITIIILLILEHRIRQLDKGKGHWALIINRLILLGLYILGIGIATWLTQAHKLILGINVQSAISTKIIEVIVLWLAAKFVVTNFSDVFERIDDIFLKKHDLSKHTHKIMRKFIKYGIYLNAIIITLLIFDLAGILGAALAGAGFAGIVIGFAAKDVIGNFFSGLSILADKPFRIGDYIQIEGQGVSGTVDEIALRSTQIVAKDNTVLTVPNSILANNTIINYTRNKKRRLILPIGIAYESDINKAINVIKKTLKKDDVVIPDKEMEVLLNGFGDSSVDLEIRVWVDQRRGSIPESKARIMQSLKEALDKNNIEIPYPRRVIIQEKPKRKKK